MSSSKIQTKAENTFTVQLGARGRLVLPAPARRQLGLEEGSRLILSFGEPGELKLTSTQVAAASCKGLLKDLAGERSLADELVAERHQAADRE